MSISATENGLVDFVKASAIGSRVHKIETLPDLDGKKLVDHLSAKAPGIYVSYATSVMKNNLLARRYAIAVVARNSRGHDEARHGDGVTIGLYEMIDFIQSLLHEQTIGDSTFTVRGDHPIKSEPLFKAGLYAAVIDLEALCSIDSVHAFDGLEDFITFTAEHTIAVDAPTGNDSVTLPAPV